MINKQFNKNSCNLRWIFLWSGNHGKHLDTKLPNTLHLKLQKIIRYCPEICSLKKRTSWARREHPCVTRVWWCWVSWVEIIVLSLNLSPWCWESKCCESTTACWSCNRAWGSNESWTERVSTVDFNINVSTWSSEWV